MNEQENLLRALQKLLNAVIDEFDMDAVSPRLGQAVNEAYEIIDRVTEVRRNDAYLDQSKW